MRLRFAIAAALGFVLGAACTPYTPPPVPPPTPIPTPTPPGPTPTPTPAVAWERWTAVGEGATETEVRAALGSFGEARTVDGNPYRVFRVAKPGGEVVTGYLRLSDGKVAQRGEW